MHTRPAHRPLRARLLVEALEDRLAPATFTVTNTDDAGTGSLRQAITRANATPGGDTIAFAIGTGAQTINLLSALPAITDQVVIAGNTQSGFAGTPLIELNGAGAGAGTNGLVIRPGGSGTVVQKLVINRFEGDGIRIRAHFCTVAGCLIGTDSANTSGIGNTGNGVAIQGASTSNLIGGSTAGARNVLSGNGANGVLITGAGTASNRIQGNHIGTNRAGTADLGNGLHGVRMTAGAIFNVVGGAVAGVRNVISGNGENGVLIDAPGTADNRVKGNYIGTDVSGTLDLGNTFAGVHITGGARHNVVGGPVAGARNVLSGNNDHGVVINTPGTAGNWVLGNFIGTDKTGTIALGNIFSGVLITGDASGNLIGGGGPGSRNVISGNMEYGVSLSTGSTKNSVLGNFIGTDKTGTAALGNALGGVLVVSEASGNVIGGTIPSAGNLITGNAGPGIDLKGSDVTLNKVLGNFIGTDVTGTIGLGNSGPGVSITNGANDNVIGGTTIGTANVISGNDGSGVHISGASTTGNRVLGNRIGLSAVNADAVGNGADGVFIGGDASNNRIGGTAAGTGNVIARNTGAGVAVFSGTGNSILGNRIFENGGRGIDLGSDGVTLNDLDDADTGPNDLLNFPVLTIARLIPAGLRIAGEINTGPDKTLRIEFFVSPAADSSGFGEGRRFLGFVTVQTTAADTTPTFTVVLPSFGVAAGQVITATATDELGNTSEFSEAVALT
jgi:hypothetical protein